MGVNIMHTDDDRDLDAFKAMENLSQCYTRFLSPMLSDATCMSEMFTTNNVIEMHKRIGAHLLFEKPGGIRECWLEVIPNETRLAPCLVKKGFESLILTTKERLESCGHVSSGVALVNDLIKIAATFLIQFSYIQPFEEGNDTVLKFLVAYIFNQITMVPIILDMDNINKEVMPFDNEAVEDRLLTSLQKTNALVADVFGNQLESVPTVGELLIRD